MGARLDALHALTLIADRSGPGPADVVEACDVIARAVNGSEAYVIRAGDPYCLRVGCDCVPTTYEIKQKGYWLLWRELATFAGGVFGTFDVRDRLLIGGRQLKPGLAGTHVGTILPADESNSELLVVRGPWPGGIGEPEISFLAVARTILASLVSNVLDSDRRQRQRDQLNALADVSRAFSEASDASEVLNNLATALAKASGFDWVNLVVYDSERTRVAARAMNSARYSGMETASVFREGRGLEEQGEVTMGIALAARRMPVLLRDVFDTSFDETQDAQYIGAPSLAFLRQYWERGHVLSVGMFPIVFQDKALGMAHFSSSTRRAFDETEVRFLEALASQAATAIEGLRLYRDLEQSREELRTSEERFRSLVQYSSDIITIVDAEGAVRYVSPSAERLMGYRAEDWLGSNILSFVHPDDLDRSANSMAAVLDQPGVHPPMTLRIRTAEGSWRYIEATANNLLDLPAIRGIVFNARDVTERWMAEEAVRRSEERFRSLVQHGSDLITLVEGDTTIRYQSPSISRVLGHAADDVTGKKLSDFVHPDDLAPALSALKRAMADASDVVSGEARMRHANGTWRHMEFVGTDQRANGAIGGIVLNMRDTTERKSLEQQLRHQALHDPLTKLGNRTRFADRLQHSLVRATRTGGKVAVLFLDLDNFKGVNDTLGHSAGDKLLTEVAERIQACLRPGDTVARLGGDEFALLLEDIRDADDAAAVTRRVFGLLDTPVEIEGKELFVRASVGIAVGDASSDADGLLRDADVAMYVAKANGKARFEVFEPSMKTSMLERLELLADLQRAVERDEFSLQYQPIFLLNGGDLYGVEALVRWHHPRRGLLPPSEFIALAEESGAILALGRWVLIEACRQARDWQRRFPARNDWTMSINVSVKQLQQPGFADEVRDVLAETGVDAGRIILEITESIMVENAPLMLERLRALKQLGVRLAIDDFGTGYSSLSYLREFPLDLLKIDKSFIDDVGAMAGEKELTRAIIELGKTLDLELVAEGIERDDQVSRLTSLECDLGQGFYFARPLDAEAVDHLLSELTTTDEAA